MMAEGSYSEYDAMTVMGSGNTTSHPFSLWELVDYAYPIKLNKIHLWGDTFFQDSLASVEYGQSRNAERM